jgi:hypothetical protein
METIESLSERLEALEHVGVDNEYLGVRGGTLRVGLLVALLICALGVAPPLEAAEFTCASGNVACLIDAINQANANGEANRITLRQGTYTLTAINDQNGLPVITSPLTIRGPGAETTIIERDTSAPNFRILNVAAAGTLTLQRLTLRNGSSFDGGGIINSGTLMLIDCILTRNFAQFGGGLFNVGTVTITHTTFEGNASFGAGGGLNNGGGTVTIANSTFVRNGAGGGGGVANGFDPPGPAIMTLTNTTVAQNAVRGGGGGVANGGFAVLQSSTVAENHTDALAAPVGGGIRNNGTMLLQNTIVARNDNTFRFPAFPDDCTPFTSLGNNLIGDPTGCTISLEPTDLTGDPGLGAFTDNGRPGNGHFPLLSTSQAIDAGNNDVCFRRDQLGRRRVGPCDIGAIRFLDDDDRRQKEEDDHSDEEDLTAAVQGSR